MRMKFNLILIFVPLFFFPVQPTLFVESKGGDLPEQIPYFTEMVEAFSLTEKEIEKLNDNEFLVLNRLGSDDILDCYKYYWENDLPIIITTDMMLHLWHLLFDEYLKYLEESIIYPLLMNVTQGMYESFLKLKSSEIHDYTTISTYISVAAKLLDPTFEIPSEYDNNCNIIISDIYESLSFDEVAEKYIGTELARFIDDYSQYKPRGHYTHSEELENFLVNKLTAIPGVAQIHTSLVLREVKSSTAIPIQ